MYRTYRTDRMKSKCMNTRVCRMEYKSVECVEVCRASGWGVGQANITRSSGYSIPNRVFSVEKYLSRSVSILDNLYVPSGPQTAGGYPVRLNRGKSKRQRYHLDPETVPDKTEPPSGASTNRLLLE